ncbi:uncharacterized protein isoform X2 [Leptinotarsa decemlineata]|uniref:uncharacterized protein isoform X2 n=1 Tax=Leptinotarsa decemlineata TaxID=7539 RepID=UPI003D30A68F
MLSGMLFSESSVVVYCLIPEDRYCKSLEAIKRPSDTLSHSSRRICSEHFTPDSFIPLRGRLRTFEPHVIPTLKLTQSQLLMRSRNGSNNNPTPYQFNNTFKRLMLYHGIK